MGGSVESIDNNYGHSKLISEWIIQDYGLASNFRYVILRYFNFSDSDST
ncbi:MAG: NAD-dependent epimerase/dehydratase family protein [Cylindrospermopsis raciborskii KL1]|nr:NAD-dependent epimerase/dehydratase family protein [Cylindrospermopsis raciborskii KL1]